MSGDIAQTPLGASESARLKIKAREDALRANGIKQGRALERDEICKELGAATLEEIKVLPQVLADVDNRWQREERKEAKGAFWRGMTLGAAVGAAFVSVGYLLVVGEAMRTAFDQAREATANALAMRMVQQQASEGGLTERPAGEDHNPINGRRLPEPASAP